MSDHKEVLKSMLQDLINDRTEQATVTIHDYIVNKTQQLTGLNAEVPVTPPADASNTPSA